MKLINQIIAHFECKDTSDRYIHLIIETTQIVKFLITTINYYN